MANGEKMELIVVVKNQVFGTVAQFVFFFFQFVIISTLVTIVTLYNKRIFYVLVFDGQILVLLPPAKR